MSGELERPVSTKIRHGARLSGADRDAVAAGIVPSFARPGGNITGSQFHFPDIMAKRIELLRDEVPSLVRVAVIFNPATNRLAQR